MDTSVVLYVNESLDPASVAGAMHVSQDGVLVSGTVNVSSAGWVVEFVPDNPRTINALVPVFLDSTATDLSGNALFNYQSVHAITIAGVEVLGGNAVRLQTS